MNLKLLIIVVILLSIILVLPILHYYDIKARERKIAVEECVKACREASISGIDLTAGPCLLNPIQSLKNWVCDVVHNPRQKIDDLPENQCPLFVEGRAKYFVEVDQACNFVRVS